MSKIVPARRVVEETNPAALLDDRDRILELADHLRAGDVVVVRRAVDPTFLGDFREYLRRIANSSLPNYQAIERKAPNFHRVYGDPRSYVAGRFHQFSFFPWNQDVLRVFEQARSVYTLNNRINGWPDDKYLGLEPEQDCIARITVQAYPRGIGHIRRHTDAVGPHKFTTVSVSMSRKGIDYTEGGLYLTGTSDIGDIDADAGLDIGDAVWIHSHVPHEVRLVDPNADVRWLALEGKWTMICAVNKLASTGTVENSAQLP